MGSFLTQVKPTSENTLYNYRSTGFVKLKNVASGTVEDSYILSYPSQSAGIVFTVTSAKLSGVADLTGVSFVIDTNLASNVILPDVLTDSTIKKTIKI